ncbi:uncharacterized protein JCM6883_002813 [Sporobolomyces salmoneus]|uniref:uncharacterized protein n=1 Tax=Sporobolomyces salmoneus TaxID=183962 RepID=UPI00318095FA
MPTLIETVKAAQHLEKVLFPPLCFSTVLPGVFRSGHPNRHNSPYLDSLALKSIMYLSTDEYRSDTYNWANERGLNIFHIRIDVSKDPTVEVDADLVAEALEKVLDSRNLPILIHDNKGRILPSLISAILRLLTNWTLESALLEYRSFLPPAEDWVSDIESKGNKERLGKPKKEKERIGDIQLIDRFPLERLRFDLEFAPSWLKDR